MAGPARFEECNRPRMPARRRRPTAVTARRTAKAGARSERERKSSVRSESQVGFQTIGARTSVKRRTIGIPKSAQRIVILRTGDSAKPRLGPAANRLPVSLFRPNRAGEDCEMIRSRKRGKLCRTPASRESHDNRMSVANAVSLTTQEGSGGGIIRKFGKLCPVVPVVQRERPASPAGTTPYRDILVHSMTLVRVQPLCTNMQSDCAESLRRCGDDTLMCHCCINS